MNKEANRWFRQAEANLKATTDSLRGIRPPIGADYEKGEN